MAGKKEELVTNAFYLLDSLIIRLERLNYVLEIVLGNYEASGLEKDEEKKLASLTELKQEKILTEKDIRDAVTFIGECAEQIQSAKKNIIGNGKKVLVNLSNAKGYLAKLQIFSIPCKEEYGILGEAKSLLKKIRILEDA